MVQFFYPHQSSAIHPEDRQRHRWLMQHQGLELREQDINQDQVADVFYFFLPQSAQSKSESESESANAIQSKIKSKEQLIQQEFDINHDTRIDIIRRYQQPGNVIVSERLDLDFDGHIDQTNHYRDGTLVRQEISTRYQGFVDLKKYYQNGELLRIEADHKGDGKIDTWEYYKENTLDKMAVDLNNDGKIDRWSVFKPPITTQTKPASP